MSRPPAEREPRSEGDATSLPVLVAPDVLALTSDDLLDLVVAEQAAAAVAELRLLELAVHYVHLHPIDDEHPPATPSRGRATGVGPGAVVDHDTGEVLEPGLAGAGTPAVALYALEELAAVLGITYLAAWQLAADALELAHRLPRLWARLHEQDTRGRPRVPLWRARQVSRQTTRLSVDAVDFVDRQLDVLTARNRLPGPVGVCDLVHEAVLRFDDADREEALQEAALAARGVWFDHHSSTAGNATTRMDATLDSYDALVLDDALADLAQEMGRLGDTSPVDVRRAQALGLLAHPQRVLDLSGQGVPEGAWTGGEAPEGDDVGGGPVACVVHSAARRVHGSTDFVQLRAPGSRINLYVHVTLAELTGTLSERGFAGCARVEEVGPTASTVLRTWLGRTERILVRPVLDPDDPDTAATRPVDRHDPPDAMRELVVLRDGGCVFPGCRVGARSCDLDHIEENVELDDGGPPGQTHPGNLACLCRRHHRLKTFTRWSYRRRPDDDYEWTSPTGRMLLGHPSPRIDRAS